MRRNLTSTNAKPYDMSLVYSASNIYTMTALQNISSLHISSLIDTAKFFLTTPPAPGRNDSLINWLINDLTTDWLTDWFID